MTGRNEYSVKNRYYYLMKAHKLESVTINESDLKKIIEKKQELIELKRQKSLRFQNLNTTTNENLGNNFNLPQNPMGLNFQSFMMNYQNFMQFQNFCLYRRNMESFVSNMQKFMNFPSKFNIFSHKKDYILLKNPIKGTL